MRLLLIGYNDGVLTALDGLWPGSVVLVEERDLWEAKKLAAKAARHPSLAETHFARYQQDRQFLELLPGLGRVDAVAPGLEYAVPAAARAAEFLGRPGAGPAAADTLCDKLALRRATQQAGMPGPRFQEVASAADIRTFCKGAPCVVKPANRQASLGVVLLDAGADLDAAWRECSQADEGAQVAKRPMRWRYLAEERLHGPEISTEALVADGTVRFVNVTAKRTAPGNRPVELGHVVPGGAGADWLGPLEQLVAAVGFRSGMLHAEWITGELGPYLIECAGRPPGDRIVDLIDAAYGTNLTELWIRTLAGQGISPPGAPQGGAAIRFVTARPGVITDVRGEEQARAQPGVLRVDLVRRPGDRLGALQSSWDRVGSVMATAGTADEAEHLAERAVRHVRVETR